MKEIWKAIDGYNSMYEVSNLGNVRSHYKHSCPLHYDPNEAHPVSQHAKNRGYMYVSLSNEGRIEHHYVHRLVARAFLERAPFENATVNHKDSDKTNNRADNLEWMSRGDNCRHSVGKYERPKGEDWHTTKLTESGVIAIRQKYAAGATLKYLAGENAVSVACIHKIVRRETWKHVK